jgi:rfaE bifunctional protein kinase chain/domain
MASKKIFVSGNFNILHPGHIRLLKFAKDLGGELIVAVTSDKILCGASYIKEADRLMAVQSNIYVDQAFIRQESILTTLDSVRPDLIVKGKEYEGLPNEELDYCKRNNAELLFSSGEAMFSTQDLIENYVEKNSKQKFSSPLKFIQNRKITRQNILNIFNSFPTLKVAVIGDLIFDEYVSCEALGMSQEDPTLVVKPIHSAQFVGGAGIVAGHSAAMGGQTYYWGVVGCDELGESANGILNGVGIKFTKLAIDPTRPTTLKKRYRANTKTLLRVSNLSHHPISVKIQDEIFDDFSAKIEDIDLLVFSDFNYGLLQQELVDKLIAKAKENGVFIVADSQCSSQLGDVSRYKNVDLICCTEFEARVSLRNLEDGLAILGKRLREETGVKNLVIKMGGDGVFLSHVDENGAIHEDRIPAINELPVDVAGAGDSMLITMGMVMASNGSFWDAAYIGSIAAGIQVGRIGNTPLNINTLLDAITVE